MIEQKIGADQFSYYLYQDDQTTGNLEVTVFKDSNRGVEGEGGKLVWSLRQSGKYPRSDWDGFIGLVQEAINDVAE